MGDSLSYLDNLLVKHKCTNYNHKHWRKYLPEILQVAVIQTECEHFKTNFDPRLFRIYVAIPF